MGVLFASPKHTLIGVDLSSSMANRARARNVYKNVIVADVLDFAKFVVPSSKIDIVLLSDVLGYIGDVSGFFEDLSLSLREQGMIALTIEVLHQGKGLPNLVVLPNQRIPRVQNCLRRKWEAVFFGCYARSFPAL